MLHVRFKKLFNLHLLDFQRPRESFLLAITTVPWIPFPFPCYGRNAPWNAQWTVMLYTLNEKSIMLIFYTPKFHTYWSHWVHFFRVPHQSNGVKASQPPIFDWQLEMAIVEVFLLFLCCCFLLMLFLLFCPIFHSFPQCSH